MTTFNLFAYGTLRRGAGAHQVLAGCEFLGEGTVGGTLYDIDGRFPALLLYGDAPVHGEIWRCPAALLLELDRYEGTADGLFRRVAVEVFLAGRVDGRVDGRGDGRSQGEPVACWTYTAGPRLSRMLLPERRVLSGRWPLAVAS